MAGEPTLYARMELRLNDFEKKLAKATKSTDTTMRKIDQSSTTMRQRVEAQFGGMTKAAAGFARGLVAPLLALGAAGAVRAIGDIANGVARIGDEAKRAGLGIQAFQELKFVAEQNRIGVDALTDGIKELNLRADEFVVTGGGSAAEAFARLGYSAEELNGKLQNPSALFTEIIGKLEGLDRAAQIRISDELFGGSGGEQFVQLISQGEAGIRAQIQAAHDLGAVLSAETIAKADELDRKFNAVATTVSSGLRAAIVDAAGALDDFLNSFGQTPSHAFAAVNGELSTAATLLRELGAAGGREFPELRARLDEVLGGITATGQGAVEAKVALLELAANPDYAPLIGDLNGVISTLINLTGQAQAARAAVLAATTDPVGSFPSSGELSNFGKPAPRTVAGSGAPPSKASSAAASTAAAQTKAILDQISALEYERTTIGLNAKELAIANALRQAGTTATDEQRTAIESLVAGNFDLQASQDQVNAQLERMDQLGQDVLGGMVNDLMAGKDAADVFANALSSIGNELLNMGLGALFDRSGGGGLASLFSGIRGRASGGPVKAGQPYIVGEKRPELFVPSTSGRIIPNVPSPGPVARAAGGSSAGVSTPIHINIDATGADAAGLLRLETRLAQMQAELPGKIKQVVGRRSKDIW